MFTVHNALVDRFFLSHNAKFNGPIWTEADIGLEGARIMSKALCAGIPLSQLNLAREERKQKRRSVSCPTFLFQQRIILEKKE